MNRSILVSLFTLWGGLSLWGQPGSPVEVCDLTLPLDGKENKELYFGFAAGDKVIINCREINGESIESFELIQYPDQVRYQVLATTEIKDKAVVVPQTGVYLIRLQNSKGKKQYAIHLQRIPLSPKTQSFNTAVRWEERTDTLYHKPTARVETKLVKLTRQVLERTDTAVINLLDKKERVHSRANWSNETTSKVQVKLPDNTREADRTTEIVSWAYWIGVGSDAEKGYQEANRLAGLAKSAMGAAKTLGVLAGPYGALASLALEGVSFFTPPPKGDNVKYRLLKGEKVLDQGDGPLVYARQLEAKQGTFTFEFTNDNYVEAIDVGLRVVAVAAIRYYRNEDYYEQREVPVFDTRVQIIRVPVVTGSLTN